MPSETKIPPFTALLKLFFTGKPLVQHYRLNISEKTFKEKLQNKITHEKHIAPFSNNNKAFYGYIYEEYGRKFILQSIRTADNKRILNHTIDIHVEIQPVDEKNIDLSLSFQPSKRLNLSRTIVTLTLVIMGAIGILQFLKNFNLKNILILSASLIFFYLAFVLFMISGMQKEIKSALAHLEIDSYGFIHYHSQ